MGSLDSTRFAALRARLIIAGYLDLDATLSFLHRMERFGRSIGAVGILTYVQMLRQAVIDVCISTGIDDDLECCKEENPGRTKCS